VEEEEEEKDHLDRMLPKRLPIRTIISMDGIWSNDVDDAGCVA
jgi:hypothetical protein